MAVIAVTSVAANVSTIIAGLAVFGDRLGNSPLVIGVRPAAFALILVGAALIPAPVRAREALEQSAAEAERRSRFRRTAPAVPRQPSPSAGRAGSRVHRGSD